MKILYLITARGGSKGVPGKNIRVIGGIPLVGYKAVAARRSRYCSRLILSTDSPEIMEVARQFDAEIPFTRPAELATDTATSFDVIRHALDYLENEEGELFDAVMLLEPSSPFATSTDLDNAVEMMINRDASLVVGVVEQKLHPVYIGEMDLDGRIGEIIDRLKTLSTTNRQAKPQQYTMNGALYLFRVDGFRNHRTIYYDTERSYGYLMDPYHSIEIDQEIDLLWAEFLVLRGYVDLTPWK